MSEMRALIQKSQQLGPYNINCEARLALGELEMKLNFPRAALNLISLAAEIRSRGTRARRSTGGAGDHANKLAQ